jgi:hypothetical protein
MTYTIKTIETAYKMTALGVQMEDFNDWAGNAAKIAAKKTEITENGALAELLALGDGQLFQVNSGAGGKPYRGFAVKGEFDVEGARVLDINAQEHAVFSGIFDDEATAADQITGHVFGGGVQELDGYKYVGPYNFTSVVAQADGTFLAEMWLPVAKIAE